MCIQWTNAVEDEDLLITQSRSERSLLFASCVQRDIFDTPESFLEELSVELPDEKLIERGKKNFFSLGSTSSKQDDLQCL